MSSKWKDNDMVEYMSIDHQSDSIYSFLHCPTRDQLERKEWKVSVGVDNQFMEL